MMNISLPLSRINNQFKQMQKKFFLVSHFSVKQKRLKIINSSFFGDREQKPLWIINQFLDSSKQTKSKIKEKGFTKLESLNCENKINQILVCSFQTKSEM